MLTPRAVAFRGGQHGRVIVLRDVQNGLLVHDAVLERGPEVQSDGHGEDLQLGQDLGKLFGHLVSLLHQYLVLADYDLPALDGSGDTGLLQLAHDGAGLEGRLALLDHDVLRCNIARLGGGRRLGGLHLLVQLEGVHGSGHNGALTPDQRLQLLQPGLLLGRLFDGNEDQVVPGHHHSGMLPQPVTHVLHLGGGYSVDIDDGDDRVLHHDVGELLDLRFLPRCYVCHLDHS
jgi:hypothetical protein